jgi:Trk-type K+ transport system membrane component
MHLYITTFRLDEVVFEEVSALCNVGLGVGFNNRGESFCRQMGFYFPDVARAP